MKDILFNSHDVALLLVIGLSFILAARTAFNASFTCTTRVLLASFYCLNAFISIDTLLFWGDSIKYAAFNISPWLPMLFSFAAFAIGPLLYWFLRSLIDPNTPIRAVDYLQLLPALATPLYLYWACYRHPLDQQQDLILKLAIFSDPEVYFLLFLTLKKMVPVIYGFLCVALILQNQPESHKRAATGHTLYLYAGFPLIWGWILTTHILGHWLPLGSSDLMGIFGNYMGLTLTVTLLFNSFGNTEATAVSIDETATEEVFTEEAIDATGRTDVNESIDVSTLSKRINTFIQMEKPYLNPQLTLERFARLVQASPRQVSFVINRYFQQNFHEYINRFRIEEAKRLLRDSEYQELTILEIAQRAGFNSKATFNRFFKSFVGITPSTYRQHPPAELAPQGSH